MMLALWTQVTFCIISPALLYFLWLITKWTHLSVVLDGKVECESSNSLSLGPSRDLQALDNTWVRRVFKSRVLSLGVFSDDGEIDIVVSSWETWEGFADNDGSVNVECLTHGDVP
jgi:hypothetical protein